VFRVPILPRLCVEHLVIVIMTVIITSILSLERIVRVFIVDTHGDCYLVYWRARSLDLSHREHVTLLGRRCIEDRLECTIDLSLVSTEKVP